MWPEVIASLLSPFQLKKGFVGNFQIAVETCMFAVCNLNKLNITLVLKEFVLIYVLTGRLFS